MDFEILSDISDVEPIAIGGRIHDIARLRKMYGKGRWRKLKGIATIRLKSGASVWLSFIGTKPMASDARK